jgi:hypothetical protein
MALAMVYLQTRQGKKNAALPNLIGKLSGEYRRQARSVLRYSMPFAQEVMSNKTSLNDAVEVVRQYEQHAATTPHRICRKGSGLRWSRVPGWAA